MDKPVPSFTIRRLDTVGYKEMPPMPAGTFDGWSFCYLIAGQVLTEVAGSALLLSGHEFLLIPPSVPFRVLWFRGSIGYMGAFPLRLPPDRGLRILSENVPARISFRTEDEGFMDELMFKLFREKDNRRLLPGCLDLLLRQLDDNLSSYRPGSLCNAFLDRLFDPDRIPGSVAACAAEAGVAPGILNRKVKAATGRTAGEWVDIARLSRAEDLLRRTSLPVIDVAVRCGLDDQSYFSRFFRKHTGLTPTQYRRQEDGPADGRSEKS